jgi:two-component system, cell cycle response regulator DivK
MSAAYVRAHGRILLVEDDAVSLKLMRDALDAAGYETHEVTSGADALPEARRLLPDLIVMDLGLPGISGVEATAQLKDAPETMQIPVLAVTAYAMPGDEQRMRTAGCDAYLTKPLSFAHFMTVVRDLLAPAKQPDAG